MKNSHVNDLQVVTPDFNLHETSILLCSKWDTVFWTLATHNYDLNVNSNAEVVIMKT